MRPGAKIEIHAHAQDRMKKRGASESEVAQTIRKAEWEAAKKGRWEAKMNFPYGRKWEGKFYGVKQVVPVFTRQDDGSLLVITVYVFYFNEQ